MTNLMNVSKRILLLRTPEGGYKKIINLLIGQSDIETNLKDEEGPTLLLRTAGANQDLKALS